MASWPDLVNNQLSLRSIHPPIKKQKPYGEMIVGLLFPGVDYPAWDVQTTLAMMDRQGIATAIVSISEPGVYFGNVALARDLARQINEFSARLVADHPQRFGAFAVLPLPDGNAALRELEYALDTLKLDGIGLLTNYRGTYLGDDALDALFAELNRRQVVAFIHPSTPPSKDQPTFGLPPSLYEFTFDTTRTASAETGRFSDSIRTDDRHSRPFRVM